MAIKIPVYQPDLGGREIEYATDALNSGWISSLGEYINRFEGDLASVTQCEHAIALSNGTVALHLALHCLGIGPGDEVIVPTFTYIASVNTIAQTGATPVFAEARWSDWLLDVEDVKRRITTRTKAIMPVHLYGAVCDPRLNELARERGLFVIEDCAEALGSSINGRHVGSDADVATFSFFGNKTVTTGEGGAVTTNNPELAAKMRKVKGQGQSLDRRYWHDELGFNYRMTNICAAIGVGQIERLPTILERKRAIGKLYRETLEDAGVAFQCLLEGVQSSDWLVSLLLPKGVDRDVVMEKMRDDGFDTRPVFYCAHHMPMYLSDEKFRVSEEISVRGISLPSYPGLSDDNVREISGSLKRSIT